MGKKKKKSGEGGGSGKKKGGKKKKNDEPEMSWKEALLAYQIHVKKRQMEDIQFEFRALEEKNMRHIERNERLKAEQVLYMKQLLKQAKEFEKQLAEEEVIDKDAVIRAMMEKWEVIRQQENEVTALKEKIARTESAYVLEQQELEKWLEYREVGVIKDDTQIELLKQELVDMQINSAEMAVHIERTMTKTREEIQKYTQETLDKQKYLASEKAMAKMDKNSRQEVMDNDWLKREVEIHKREADGLLTKVDEIEQQNLAVMAELFDCTVDDLKISRNFFLTQFKDGENLETDGILEVDLAKLSVQDNPEETAKPARPKSATAKFIEDKVFGLQVTLMRSMQDEEKEEEEDEEEEEEEADSDNASYYDGEHCEDEDEFDNFFNFEDEEFEDYLQLGPLELKLLSVRGEKLPIHQTGALTEEEVEARQYQPHDWPLTRRQIISKVNK